MNFAFPNPALVAVGSIIRSKPDVMNRFMRAYVRGMHRTLTDREFTYKAMAKYTKSKTCPCCKKPMIST